MSKHTIILKKRRKVSVSALYCILTQLSFLPQGHAEAQEKPQVNQKNTKDQAIIDFMQASHIEDHLRKTFAEIIHEFGGNIEEIKDSLTQEMRNKGFFEKDMRARLKILEDFHKNLHAAGEPLIREMLNALKGTYDKKLSKQEIMELTALFNDPVMKKLQNISMEIMPAMISELQNRALEIIKPLITEMQASIKSLS